MCYLAHFKKEYSIPTSSASSFVQYSTCETGREQGCQKNSSIYYHSARQRVDNQQMWRGYLFAPSLKRIPLSPPLLSPLYPKHLWQHPSPKLSHMVQMALTPLHYQLWERSLFRLSPSAFPIYFVYHDWFKDEHITQSEPKRCGKTLLNTPGKKKLSLFPLVSGV